MVTSIVGNHGLVFIKTRKAMNFRLMLNEMEIFCLLKELYVRSRSRRKLTLGIVFYGKSILDAIQCRIDNKYSKDSDDESLEFAGIGRFFYWNCFNRRMKLF